MNARRWAALAATVVSSSIAGCACDDNPSADTCAAGTVEITAPADFAQSGAKITVDADPATAGMMAGVTPGADAPADEKAKIRPVSAFGRYVKVLLSSNEFVFVS